MTSCAVKGECVDRRRTRRLQRTADHGFVTARVWPGCDAVLLDVSAGGALIETSCRLMPGSPIELHLATRDRRTPVRGGVLRCTIVRIFASGVCYRAAIAFDRALPWFPDEKGASEVPQMESTADHRFGADATQPIT